MICLKSIDILLNNGLFELYVIKYKNLKIIQSVLIKYGDHKLAQKYKPEIESLIENYLSYDDKILLNNTILSFGKFIEVLQNIKNIPNIMKAFNDAMKEINEMYL